MRNALRVADQELYFRILARSELLLPVSTHSLARRSPMGWGTWNSGGRTHVLAFTSIESMRLCLAEHAGSARKIAYFELAAGWPNQEWWLAVNPGLPIEGYLPPWFVGQLARGDVRLPGRTGGGRTRGFDSTYSVSTPQGGMFNAPGRPAAGATTTRIPTSDGPRTAGQVPESARIRADQGHTVSVTQAMADARRTATGRASAGSADARPTNGFTPHPPGEDEPIEAELVDVEPPTARPQQGRGRGPGSGPGGRRGDSRRRIFESTIIDAEIIESTVLGASALEAMVVNATAIDASTIDSDVIDVAVIEATTDTGVHKRPGAAEVPEATEAAAATGTHRAGASRGRLSAPTGAHAADETAETPVVTGAAPRHAGASDDTTDSLRTVGRARAGAAEPQATDQAGTGGTDAAGTAPAHAAAPSGPGFFQPSSARTAPPADPDPTTRINGAVRGAAAAAGARGAARAAQPPGTAEPPRGTRRPQHAARAADDTAYIPTTTAPAGQPPTAAPGGTTVPPGGTPAGTGSAGTTSAGAAPAAPTEPGTVAGGPGTQPPDRPASDASRATTPAGAPAGGGRSAEAPPQPAKPSFTPANDVEAELLGAATSGQTDKFLSTLLLAKVLIPVPPGGPPDVRPDNPEFPWRREVVDGQPYLVVFTSPERLKEFMGEGVVTATAKFVQLIRYWPDVKWAFAVNPGSPVGATLPGIQVKALSAWADDVGLTDDDPEDDYEEPPAPAPNMAIIMQKPIAPSQVDYYLERGYDRASGFVHRATEVAHLQTPERIYSTLGLSYSGSPFVREASEVFVLRWTAHRPDLYRIPYGGQHEAQMRAMQGWMIERPPFRGNGFAPAEGNEVIAEFKVDSIRLPHGAQMWRLTADGQKTQIAVLDADETRWRPVRGVSGDLAWDPTTPPVATVRSVEAGPSRPLPPNPTDDPLDPRWRGDGADQGAHRSG